MIWTLLPSCRLRKSPFDRRFLVRGGSALSSTLMASGMPKPSPSENDNGRSREFYLNRGRAIDTLRLELPHLLSKGLSTWDIYSKSILLTEPHHNKFYTRGLGIYRSFLWTSRLVINSYFAGISFQLRSFHSPTDDEVHVRWSMEGTPRMSLLRKYLFRLMTPDDGQKSDFVERAVFEGVFIYRFDAGGVIKEHHVTDIMPAPRKFAPLHAIGWWQRGRMEMPEFNTRGTPPV
eukprot:Partr_v1_DN28694_c1_g1_i1_m50056 putative Uncharacterized conserved protein (DUF2358)